MISKCTTCCPTVSPFHAHGSDHRSWSPRPPSRDLADRRNSSVRQPRSWRARLHSQHRRQPGSPHRATEARLHGGTTVSDLSSRCVSVCPSPGGVRPEGAGMNRALRERSSSRRRGRVVLAVAAFVGGVLVMAAPAHAVPSTLYVDRNNPGCSNVGPGTVTQPLCTIAAGATRAIAGTTVIVSTGTYPDQVTVKNSGSSAEPIVFMPAAGANVTISGPMYGFLLSGKSLGTSKEVTST